MDETRRIQDAQRKGPARLAAGVPQASIPHGRSCPHAFTAGLD